MELQSTISAFQKVLTEFKFNEPVSFSESFAQTRFLKKFQKPGLNSDLADLCFKDWLSTDLALPHEPKLMPKWFNARLLCHKLSNPSFADVGLPAGSEFVPTNGQDSLEAKLCASVWTVTKSAFDDFSRICYRHKALKRAFRNRYYKWYHSSDFDMSMSASNRFLYNRFSPRYNCKKQLAFEVFKWKLRQIVTFVEGSRFATVPKNNEKDRPINIEPFCNMVVQRTIGNWLRSEISRIFNIDLDHLAEVHRKRLKDVDRIATIDLKNASDCISLDLCRFLLPTRVMRVLDRARSFCVLGLDDDYHVLNKISSMGNGFTFELMSFILTALCRCYDESATVFGDDIIIAPEFARDFISTMESAGLQVNLEKSFIEGDFRESCGGNYHKIEGYVESYDFTWPDDIYDCVLIYNKCRRLRGYPSFKRLYDVLTRTLPKALHGGTDLRFDSLDTIELIGQSRVDLIDSVFPGYFVTPSRKGGNNLNEEHERQLRDLCYHPSQFKLIQGFSRKPKLRSNTEKHLSPRKNWAKYEMYLDAGRRTPDALSNTSQWHPVWFLSSDNVTFRARSLE